MNNELTAALATIEKCREITNCPAGVDLQDHLRQLAAENVALSPLIAENWNMRDLLRQLMAGRPGGVYFNKWEKLIVGVLNETPATDRIVAGIKAEVLPVNIAEIIDSGDLETICWQHEHYKAEDYRLALYRFRTDREEAANE